MPEQLENIIEYIIRFLLREENSHLVDKVGYTSQKNEYHKYAIIIKPSGFFDNDRYATPETIPILPLQYFEDLPILFGNGKFEKNNTQIILEADIIASTYFLISRYEEMVRSNVRDEHGRFPGKESLPYKAGFLNRPLVDEYAKLLRKLLKKNGMEVFEPSKVIKKIYLTHDVDKIAHYRNLRSFLGAVLRFPKKPKNAFTAFKTYFGHVESDPWFTFPWLFNLNLQLEKNVQQSDVEQVVFIKNGGGSKLEDFPLQNILSKDYQELFKMCRHYDIEIGLHPSYQAGIDNCLISDEKEKLEEVIGENIQLVRHHYLASREPQDFNALIKNGFTDDFTMGYADVSGFRLGTCRAVKWIDPVACQLTELTLHPLTVMDTTLHESKYMNLSYDAAKRYCSGLIEQVENHTGELVLLWHNTSVEKDNGQYHRVLYQWMIEFLQKNDEERG